MINICWGRLSLQASLNYSPPVIKKKNMIKSDSLTRIDWILWCSIFFFCITCFLTSGEVGFGGGRVLLPVFLLCSKHWVNVGYSQTHMKHVLRQLGRQCLLWTSASQCLMLGTARSPHDCWHTFLLTAWQVSDITFDLITKILIDG